MHPALPKTDEAIRTAWQIVAVCTIQNRLITESRGVRFDYISSEKKSYNYENNFITTRASHTATFKVMEIR